MVQVLVLLRVLEYGATAEMQMWTKLRTETDSAEGEMAAYAQRETGQSTARYSSREGACPIHLLIVGRAMLAQRKRDWSP